MNVLSLFSGAGGFDLGLERAGMKTVFQCEWDKHAIKVLEHHWPDVPRWTDISTLTGAHILEHAPVIDVVAWGSPCQDMSVGGRRTGLEGSRSVLFYEGIRIIKEIRRLTNDQYPRISVWENVAGALSSNKGRDFGAVLDEMGQAGACFSEWKILDAQYFGIPQRRRRVFVISVFDPATAARCPDPLLPISESLRGNTKESRQTKQDSPAATEDGIESSSFRMRGFADYEEDDKASAIKARDYKDSTDLIVDPPILLDRAAFNQGENDMYPPYIGDDPVSPTLVARGPHAVAHIGPSYVLRERAGKPGGGKGPLVSEEKTLAIKTVNDLSLFTPAMRVRRLTPIECERLMGWPDDWTSGQADTHRYKQCGNGVAAPVATWIGEQLMKLDA